MVPPAATWAVKLHAPWWQCVRLLITTEIEGAQWITEDIPGAQSGFAGVSNPEPGLAEEDFHRNQ